MNIHASPNNDARKIRKGEQFVWTPEKLSFAADLWSRGHTSTHIAKELCISRSSFSGMASRNKEMFPPKMVSLIPKTKVGTWTKERVADCIRFRKEGKSITATALAIGMTRSSVDSLIRKRPEWFEPDARPEAAAAPVVSENLRRRSFIAGRWVDRVPFTTISGAVVSLPRVSILNGKEG